MARTHDGERRAGAFQACVQHADASPKDRRGVKREKSPPILGGTRSQAWARTPGCQFLVASLRGENRTKGLLGSLAVGDR